jgi:hypothetical protein
VAVRVRAGSVFCQSRQMGEMPLVKAKAACVRVPVDGSKLLVMINFQNGEQKTLPAVRRPAARVDFVPGAGSVLVP